jgi:hypothetical protein
MSQHNGEVHNGIAGTVGGTVIQCGDLTTCGIALGEVGRVVEVPDCDTITILDGRLFVDGHDGTA